MIDRLFAVGLSNACFALILAAIAMVVSAKFKRPHLAHMLWLLVFVKLVTPAVVTIPIPEISATPQHPITTENIDPSTIAIAPTAGANNLGALTPSAPEFQAESQTEIRTEASSFASQVESALLYAQPYLMSIWLMGSMIVFSCSLFRVFRFNRLLSESTEPAPDSTQAEASEIAIRLGMKTAPTIFTTSARVSPMVWWIGGKVRIIMPNTLLTELDAKQIHFVLAHELAHVRRKDYLVRWLEWLVCVCFWWNPIAWWDRRNLRTMEEICCDALVLSSLKPKPAAYASSLLTAVECLAQPALRPPAVASEINSGGFLERRFKMIVSKTPIGSSSRWVQACVVMFAMAVLPLGVVYATDYEAVERRLGEIVAEGELTLRQAADMLDTLRHSIENNDEEDDEGRHEERDEHAKRQIGNWIEEESQGLKEAVEAGKISEKDAHEKWEYFKHKELAPKLKAMVDEGHISEESAVGIWNHVNKGEEKKHRERGESRHKPAQHNRGDQPDWDSIKHRVEGAVKAGKMSREEANRTYERIKKEHASRREHEARGDDPRRQAHEYLMRLKRELGKAVEAGKIGGNEAEEKYKAAERAIRERLERSREHHEREGREERGRHEERERRQEREHRESTEGQAREHLMRLRRELGKAVEAGKLDGNDAERKYGEAEKAINQRLEHSRAQDERERERDELDRERDELERERENIKRERINNREHREERERRAEHDQPDWENIKRRVEGAVKAGKMSREEANKVYEGIKKRMATQRGHDGKRDREDDGKREHDEAIRRKIEEVGRQIREAVRAGKITEEQGRERMEGFMKSLRKERD